jgi:threonine/homoserine/homoserine lactone efflux protein
MADVLTLMPIAGAVLLGVMSPGPNFMLVTTVAARSRAAALAIALGFGLAAIAWAAASVAGLTLLVARVGWLYRLVQISGGCYLIYIGVRMMARGKRLSNRSMTEGRQASPFALIRRGFVTNIGNPKSAAFYSSVFATLLPHHASEAILAAAITLTGLVSLGWYGMMGLLFSTPGIQGAYARAAVVVDRIAGGVLSLLGLSMVARA